MSNNKQSSVEMIEEFLLSHCNPTICNVEWSDFKLMFEQAKAMHKNEIIEAFDEGQEYEYQYHINSTPKFDSKTYYNETFGDESNN